MRQLEGHLRFDNVQQRYVLDGCVLHCGDVIEIFVNGCWLRTRIEHTDDWVLCGGVQIHGKQPYGSVLDGLEARSLE